MQETKKNSSIYSIIIGSIESITHRSDRVRRLIRSSNTSSAIDFWIAYYFRMGSTGSLPISRSSLQYPHSFPPLPSNPLCSRETDNVQSPVYPCLWWSAELPPSLEPSPSSCTLYRCWTHACWSCTPTSRAARQPEPEVAHETTNGNSTT